MGSETKLKPNFIIIFMDDMGYGDMGCYDSPAIKTPNMDAVAERGVKFTQMYSAAPICTPSRFGLLTGRYPQRVGLSRVLFPDDKDGISDREETIADYLKQAGYSTCGIGKWHLGCLPEHYPTRHGFDYYFGLLYSNDMNPLYLYRNEEIIEKQVDQALLTRRYMDEALAFIEKHRNEPFFVYIAHTMPHIPLHVEESFRGKSAGGTYGDTIECIDHHLGRLFHKLEELDLFENTLLIISSDNGPWFEGSTSGLRGRKFDVYEGGIRMPFVGQCPALLPQKGIVFNKPASLMDILPTFLDLAGVKLSEDNKIDGLNIWPAFKGESILEREAFYYFFKDSLNAIRVGKWKLHVARGDRGQDTKEMPQLFDMEKDPEENYNVANLHLETVEKLEKMIEEFQDSI